MDRRTAIHRIAGAFIAVQVAGAAAAQFPDRPVTIVVPYAPGAAPDTIVRLLAPKLSAAFGQPVVVENKPGASGNIGAAWVAKAPADGHAVLFATQPMVTINPYLFKSMGYDPATELTPITTAVNVVMALDVSPGVPAKNVEELLAYVRKHPGTPFGTSGVGTPMHLAGLRLNRQAGIELNHVAYRGGMLVLNDLMAGTIKVGIVDLASSRPLAEAGKLKILAIGEAKRFDGAPDIPTISESIPGFEITSWFGFFGPGKMPAAIVERWNTELRRALLDPEIDKRLHGMGLITRVSSPEELDRLVRSERESFGKLIHEQNVTIE